MMAAPWISSFWFLIMLLLCYSAIARPSAYPSANLSTTWINWDDGGSNTITFRDESMITPVLITKTDVTTQYIVCGFFCNGTCTSYIFAIFIIDYDMAIYQGEQSHVIWSANEDHPIMQHGTLNLTAAGELVLQDVDGTKVWNTNTAGKSVVGMNLTGTGNLVLFDAHNSVVWQSFDHPKDCLLPGQTLFQGQKLISSVSSTNWTKGQYFLQVTNDGLFAYVESNPPQVYYNYKATSDDDINKGSKAAYARFLNGSFNVFTPTKVGKTDLPVTSSAQFIKLMPDGHLQLFQWQDGTWTVVKDLLTTRYGDCFYPLACGRNAVCSTNQQCSCPGIDYFKPVNNRQPNLGCSEITPLTCNATQDQVFIPLENIDYSTFTATLENVSMEACKQACLKNCSCKAALFRKYSNASDGDCCLRSDLFTIMTVDIDQLYYNASAFIKVQNVRKPKNRVVAAVLRPPTIAGIVVLVVVVSGVIMFRVHKRKRNAKMEEDEQDLTQLPDSLSLLSGSRHEEAILKNKIVEFFNKDVKGTSHLKISLDDIRLATNGFGEANIIARSTGFGKVYRGQSAKYGLVAIKQLDRMRGQGDREFWMEISLLSICKHENIVSLVGFCDENGEKILVYKYERNGSLDRHLRSKDLTWMHRLRICIGAACGLKYLHDDVGPNHRVIHRDMKSANILLDENWKPKISDFGLSKIALANVPLSAVHSNPCGTLGYIDPQYVDQSTLTQKSDVYSFGVVLFEVLFGRQVTLLEHPNENHFSVKMARNHFEKKTLEEMIDADLKSQMKSDSLSTFSSIAYECVKEHGEKRPKMIQVIEQLKKALNHQGVAVA